MKRYDPLYIDDRGNHSYGMINQSEDGDFVKYEDAMEEIKKLKDELEKKDIIIADLQMLGSVE